MEDTPEIEQEQKKEEVVYQPFNTKEERMGAMTEIQSLSAMINSHFYYPHFDNGNNGKQQPKLTKSTALSVFSQREIDVMVDKMRELYNRLNAK